MRTLSDLMQKYIYPTPENATPIKGYVEVPYAHAKYYVDAVFDTAVFKPVVFLFEDRDTQYSSIRKLNLKDSPLGKYAEVVSDRDLSWHMMDLCEPRTFVSGWTATDLFDEVEFYRIAHNNNNATNLDFSCKVENLEERVNIKFNHIIIKHIDGDGVIKPYDLVIMYSRTFIQAWRVRDNIVVDEYPYTDDINDILRSEGVDSKYHATKFEFPNIGHLTKEGLTFFVMFDDSDRLVINDEGSTHQAEYYSLGTTTDEECEVVYDNSHLNELCKDDEDTQTDTASEDENIFI